MTIKPSINKKIIKIMTIKEEGGGEIREKRGE